jgi:hypothetical protein
MSNGEGENTTYNVLPKGMIHVLDNTRFHHATQNDVQFKFYELFVSGKFPFNIF